MANPPIAREIVPFDVVVTGNGGIVTGDYDITPGYYVLGAWHGSAEATGSGSSLFLWLEYAQGGSTDQSVDGRMILNSTSTYSVGSGHSRLVITPGEGYGLSADGKLTVYVGASVNLIDYRVSGYLIRIR